MTYLVEVPVQGGGRLLVEADTAELPDDLELASGRPGEMVTRAKETLERSLDQLKPAVDAVAQRLRAVGPDEFRVEFGLKLAAESGLVVAKGTSEVHFNVTLAWGRTGGASGTKPDDADG
jgi:hypothetical protein